MRITIHLAVVLCMRCFAVPLELPLEEEAQCHASYIDFEGKEATQVTFTSPSVPTSLCQFRSIGILSRYFAY